MLLAHELVGRADAPALILIHGITDCRRTWHPLLHKLAEGNSVLAVDLRGHGESDSDDPYDPITYAADVIETAAALGVTDPIVVGHSLGGVVASAFAATAPCRAVLNIDQPLRLSGFKDALTQLEPMLRGNQESFEAALEMMFSAMDGPLAVHEQARVRLHRRADQAVVLGTWASVFESTPAELDATVEQLAAGITVPYLSLHGLRPVAAAAGTDRRRRGLAGHGALPPPGRP
jgi:pimeloyl-ACP methyl ester carboxylesterase